MDPANVCAASENTTVPVFGVKVPEFENVAVNVAVLLGAENTPVAVLVNVPQENVLVGFTINVPEFETVPTVTFPVDVSEAVFCTVSDCTLVTATARVHPAISENVQDGFARVTEPTPVVALKSPVQLKFALLWLPSESALPVMSNVPF